MFIYLREWLYLLSEMIYLVSIKWGVTLGIIEDYWATGSHCLMGNGSLRVTCPSVTLGQNGDSWTGPSVTLGIIQDSWAGSYCLIGKGSLLVKLRYPGFRMHHFPFIAAPSVYKECTRRGKGSNPSNPCHNCSVHVPIVLCVLEA